MPSISTVTGVDEWNMHVDTVTASAFSVMNIDEFDSIAQCEVQSFASKLNQKLEVYKFSMWIGSVNVDNVPCDLWEDVDKPTFMDIHDFEPHISAAQASKPKTILSDFLSKIWNILENLAMKVLDQTTQLNRQGADNDLSHHFSTNDRMLRSRCINSQFFTDTFFVTMKGRPS